MNLAIRTDENGNSISNVELGDSTSLEVQLSDDEVPVVTYSSSATEISENKGSVTITANLSNAKLSPTSINLSLDGTSEKLIDYSVSSIYGYKNYLGSVGSFGSSAGVGSDARFEYPSKLIII